MTTEIKVTREGGSHHVSVAVCSRNKDGSPGEMTQDAIILKERGDATHHHVYDSQCVVVTELENTPVEDGPEPKES